MRTINDDVIRNTYSMMDDYYDRYLSTGENTPELYQQFQKHCILYDTIIQAYKQLMTDSGRALTLKYMDAYNQASYQQICRTHHMDTTLPKGMVEVRMQGKELAR